MQVATLLLCTGAFYDEIQAVYADLVPHCVGWYPI